MKAAATGRIYMVKKLLEHGADPFEKSPTGQTALDKANLYNRWEIAEYLEDYMKSYKAKNSDENTQKE